MKKLKKKTKKSVPKESEIQRIKEFETFAEWLALSPLLKLLSEEQLTKIGVDDPREIELLKIKTQTEFAKKFKLSIDTLTDWKKRSELWELVDKYLEDWGAKKTPSVILGLYRKAVSEGDAPRVKLWLEYFKKFKETSKVEHGGKINFGYGQKISTDPILKKTVEFYERELKNKYRGGDNRREHVGLDRKGKDKKRKRRTD